MRSCPAQATSGFPTFLCLTDSKQILISSPALLAIAAGTCPAAALRTQAASKGLKPANYRGIELWISPGKTTLSVAQWSDWLLLIGMRKTLEAAIDRNLPEADASENGRSAESKRRYSPLLARAARIAEGRDLWVVASQMPDPLASLFVPLDAEARSFEGSASIRDGLELEGTLVAASPQAAAEIAQTLEQSIPVLPGIAQRPASQCFLRHRDLRAQRKSGATRGEPSPRRGKRAAGIQPCRHAGAFQIHRTCKRR